MKNILKRIITIKIVLLIILLNFYFGVAVDVNAAINKQINYQGRLLDGSGDAVADANYNIDFALYTVATMGSPLWTETQTVETRDGLFSVMLGSVDSLDGVDFNQTLYLSLDVEADGEMTPRKVLGAVTAAFEADKLDGVSSEQFFRNDQSNSTSTSGTFFTLIQNGSGKLMELFDSEADSLFSVNSNGNIGIGSSSPEYRLSVDGDLNITGAFRSSGSAGVNGYVLQTTGSGIQWVATSSLGISGGGSDVWSSLGSDIYFSSGRVGIGLTSPSERLDVSGNVKISGNVSAYGDFSAGRTYISQVGTGLTFSQSGQPSLTKLSSTTVAYMSSTQDVLTTYSWNGSNWSQVGSGLSTAVGTVSLATLDSSTIALVDNANDQIRTYSWNGSNWSQVGSGLSLTAFSGNPNITAINSTDIAFIESGADTLRTYRWNGSTWSQVGSGLDVGVNLGTPAVDMLNTNTLVLTDGTQDYIISYSWNGSTWSQIGNSLSIAGVTSPSITSINSSDVIVVDGTTDEITMFRWDGTNWRKFGETFALPSSVSNVEVVSLTGTDFAFVDTGDDTLITYRITDSVSFTSTDRSLGIGTDAPSATLDLRGTAGINPILVASSSGSTMLKLTQSGYFGIGTDSPQKTLHVSVSTDDAPVRFQDSNGYCEINPTSTTWTCTSDERLKENIISVASSTPDLVERMMKLRTVTFEWKTDESNSQRVGFIAQEVEVLFPDFVTTDSKTGLKSVSYGAFIPYIISVFQDLTNKVQLLSQKIDELTSDGVTAFSGLITKLTVGSKENPTGITLFDESTGDPYCLSVKNGDVVTRIGECVIDEQDNSNDDLVVDEQSIESDEEIVPVQESSNSNENPNFTSNIEDTNDQDVVFETTESASVENNLLDQSIQEDDETVEVETNQSSGSVDLPIE